MQNDLAILKQCPLFAGIAGADLQAMLACLSAARQGYARGEFIFRADDRVSSVGIVLSGGAHVIQEDFWGNRTILAQVEPGELFAEAFSCAEVERLPVSVVAVERSEILLIDYHKIITACPNTCTFHAGLIGNMMRVLARKNVQLTRKMEMLSMRTTREKLLAFLSAQALERGSGHFDIPFNRQQLADYLCVDRSALSRELGRMQEEGVLRFEKSRFELLQ